MKITFFQTNTRHDIISTLIITRCDKRENINCNIQKYFFIFFNIIATKHPVGQGGIKAKA